MRIMHLPVALTLSLTSMMTIGSGCASSASQQAEKPTPATTPKVEGATKLDGGSIFLYKDRSKQNLSLLEALKVSGKKVAIFQFAGIECASCRDEAKELETKIAADPNGKSIAHVLVLTDFFKDYTDAEFAEFRTTFAPSAILAYDEARIWKQFSEDPSLPSRATIFTMNLKGEAIIFNVEGKQISVFEAAVALLKGS